MEETHHIYIMEDGEKEEIIAMEEVHTEEVIRKQIETVRKHLRIVRMQVRNGGKL